jgi:hypothetical protein
MTNDNVSWKANILAEDVDDAIKMIKKNVKKFDKIWSTEAGDDVHFISDKINKFLGIGQKPQQKPQQKQNENIYLCPWCEKSYPTPKGLQIHISRMHKKGSNENNNS